MCSEVRVIQEVRAKPVLKCVQRINASHTDVNEYSQEFRNSIYRMAGKFGGEFNLAVWRIMNAPPN